MRIIIIILLVFLQQQLPAQAETSQGRPSPKQRQDQIAQARNESLQMIAELEKEIAEATKRGDDPESIIEMKKQLATLKKMTGVANKAANIRQSGPKNIDGVNSVPPYKSPYTRFFKQAVAIPAKAQAKDKLLWYRGKKINQTTLVTTGGRIVQYDRQNNRVMVQYNEKKDTPILKIVASLSKSRQWTNTYVNNKSAEKNSFFDYPLVKLVMKKYELIEKQFDKLANNTLELPGTGTNPVADISFESFSNSRGPSANYQFNAADSVNPYVQEQYEFIMSLVNNPPSLDVYPPPKEEYSLCYYCDELALEQYEREKEIWSENFKEYEVEIIGHCMSIFRYYALLGISDIEDILNHAMLSEIYGAQKFAEDRIEKKIKILKQLYENDIYRYTAVISEVLGWERYKALLGFSDEFTYEFEIFKSKVFENFIRQRIAANDYDVIFNYAMIFGFARLNALIGGTDDNFFTDLIPEIVNHNRFALTLNLDFDFQMGEDPILIANGSLSTKNKIYVKLGRNKDCKWQFYLFDADYEVMTNENDYKLPLVVNSGTKKVKKGNAWETFTYSGPTDLLMPFPSFRISFCPITRPDSAYMEILRYEQEDLSGYDVKSSYSADLLAYVNKMFVSPSKTKANADDILGIADQMVSLASSPVGINPTGYAKLDKMQAEFNGNGLQHDLQQGLTETSKVENTIILFDAQNGSQFLINSTTNTANSEYSRALDLKKGLITLKVVLEPLTP